jgi:hypothetical protein
MKSLMHVVEVGKRPAAEVKLGLIGGSEGKSSIFWVERWTDIDENGSTHDLD